MNPRPRALVVGLVRNAAGTLAADLGRLRHALSGVGDLQWLLIESDSHDGTATVLRGLATDDASLRYESLGPLAERFPLRTVRIAHCRNAYLAAIRDDPRYADLDYVIVSDLDGINDALTPAAIASCFARTDWDACMANQRGPYYDIWALRHPLWSPNDCWRHYEFLTRLGVSEADALQTALHARMIRIDEHREWIAVDSAFGGIALYRREALRHGAYEGLHADGREQCEHVTLHAAMRAAGRRLFINPAFVNAGETEHTASPSLDVRLRRAVRAAINQQPLLGRWHRHLPPFDPFTARR